MLIQRNNAPLSLPPTQQNTVVGQEHARETPLPDAGFSPRFTKIRNALVKRILDYQNLSPERSKQLADQLPASARSSAPIDDDVKFHVRDPALNQLPLFFSAFDTEIASAETLKTLPRHEQDFHAVRMIGKRFIDTKTGNSFYPDATIGKANPTLPLQNRPVREIRSQAATATFDRYKGTYIRDLYQFLVKKLGVPPSTSNGEPTVHTVHLVRPGRGIYANDTTINFLSLATQAQLTDTLNTLEATQAKAEKRKLQIEFCDIKQGIVVSRTARSNASPIGRLVQQGYFDTSEIKPGDNIVIADDHTQAGATILVMAAALKQAGAQVLAAVTPTVHPFCAQLGLSDNVKQLLDATLKKWDENNSVRAQFLKFGMPLETLTNHEAMIVIAYATDPNDPAAVSAFQQLEATLMEGRHVLQGESDSLAPILRQTPFSPDEVVKELVRECAQSRTLVMPTPIEDVHVVDWDDFLRDEKGMNYQLMHNALAVAASEYASTHPLIQEIAVAVADARGHEHDEGVPKLCLSPAQFSAFAHAHPAFIKRDMVTDLIANLAPVNSSLAEKLQAASAMEVETISNILQAGFGRQYARLVGGRTWPHKSSVPYPEVTLTLMPGAQAFLDQHRNASERIVLLSNRRNAELQQEINQMGMAHYFDVAAGVSEVTLGEEVVCVSKKPDPARLREALKQLPGASGARITLWGDRPGDIHQANNVAHQGAIRGVLVNPEQRAFEVTRSQTTIPVSHRHDLREPD